MQGLRRLLYAGEVIGPSLERLADFVHRQPGIGKCRHMSLARQQSGEIPQTRGLFAVGAIKLDDAAGDVRRRFGDLHQLLVPRQFAGKQRIGKDLAQLRKTAARLTLKLFEIDLVDGGQFQEQLHRQRPLVALDEIQIGRRDAKRLGHGRLRQLKAVADPPDPRPRKDLVLGHCNSLYKPGR